MFFSCNSRGAARLLFALLLLTQFFYGLYGHALSHCLWRVDCRNAKGNFHFERTVRYRKSNDENQEVLEI